ncbi:MAG TPA: DUF885 domain-containing protein [Kofleriaceae bacterium]|nr:DUF885 domain-containing protein [Kofleriaceae bacterium]
MRARALAVSVMVACAWACAASACGPSSATRATTAPPAAVAAATDAADGELSTAIEAFLDGYFAFRPNVAIDLGYHTYDGQVPDRSPAAITTELGRLRAARTTFAAFDARELSPRRRVEQQLVLREIAKEIFELDVRRRPFRDPFFYLFKFSLNAYISRDYAPAGERAAAMLRACKAAPAYYAQAAENLEAALPKAWLQAAIMISGGTVQFLGGDAKQAFAALPDEALRGELGTCLEALAKDVAAFRDALTARMPAATDDFRLGAENLVAMLRETEGLEVDLATLERVAREDLARNHAAIVAAAAAVDPKRDAAAVIAEAARDKPAPDAVLAEATGQLGTLRRFLVDKQIVSLPREDVIEVRASPPFMRGNFAALGSAGAFETAALPSYYYIAPPDPSWPADQQRAYVMSRADLLFTSAHEVFPGHFVQGMHERASDSRVLKTFEVYTASEGWAHYVEEMMWDAGLGDGDPRVHIGQLKNALLRDVRFVVALGYHAGTMTVEDATRLFIEQAYADPKTAAQQALRGTVDPMFLGYTLGKLVIMELRTDWLRANPGKSLRDFHDAFLGYGEAPLAVTRRLMLGDDAGPPLRATPKK